MLIVGMSGITLLVIIFVILFVGYSIFYNVFSSAEKKERDRHNFRRGCVILLVPSAIFVGVAAFIESDLYLNLSQGGVSIEVSRLPALIPSETTILSHLQLDSNSSEYTDNEEIASRYDNPTEVFRILEDFGRIRGYYAIYNVPSCSSFRSDEITSATISIVEMKNPSGVRRYFDWSEFENNLNSHAPIIGNGTHSRYYENDSTQCSQSLDVFLLSFHSYNYLFTVTVYSSAMTRSELTREAERLANLIELRLEANRK